MLVQALLSDPLLEAFSVIIIDEAHERTLRTDLLLSRLKDIQNQRKSPARNSSQRRRCPLKVVIMSATLDAEKFSRFYDGSVLSLFKPPVCKLLKPSAKILYVQGRQHPVKIFYTSEPQPDFLDAALKAFFQIHNQEEVGDILIFLPGSFLVILFILC
jgi:ATP-dependent RNA helicase DHX33